MSSPPDWLQKSSAKGKMLLKQTKPKASAKATTAAAQAKEKITGKEKPFFEPPPKGPVSRKYIWMYETQKKAPSVLKTKLSTGEKALLDLVRDEIATSPHEHFGQLWAAQTMAWYAGKLGITERQVNRRVRSIPLVWRQAKVNGTKLPLLRDGEPADKTPYDFAQMMSAEFRKRLKRQTSAKQFGSLVHFAQEFKEYSVDVFCTILDDWGGFMAAVKIAITDGLAGFDPYSKDPSTFRYRYYQFPSIQVIRRFSYVAYHYYEDRLKEEENWEAEQGNAKPG
jgi:hypothetical protein